MRNVISRIHILVEDWENEETALKRVQAEKKLTEEQFQTYKICLYKEGEGTPYKIIKPVRG